MLTDRIWTYSGRGFSFLNPEPSDITIRDIAHALGMLCRYTGHCNRFYSVAEHSILVSRLVPPKFALEGLLHDAAEAYLGDLSYPVKWLLPNFIAMEHNIMAAVRRRFNLLPSEPPAVKTIDRLIRSDEMKQLFLPCTAPDYLSPDVVGRAFLQCLSPDQACVEFLARYYKLIGET